MSSKPNGLERLIACHPKTVISKEQGDRVGSHIHHPSPIIRTMSPFACRISVRATTVSDVMDARACRASAKTQ